MVIIWNELILPYIKYNCTYNIDFEKFFFSFVLFGYINFFIVSRRRYWLCSSHTNTLFKTTHLLGKPIPDTHWFKMLNLIFVRHVVDATTKEDGTASNPRIRTHVNINIQTLFWIRIWARRKGVVECETHFRKTINNFP